MNKCKCNHSYSNYYCMSSEGQKSNLTVYSSASVLKQFFFQNQMSKMSLKSKPVTDKLHRLSVFIFWVFGKCLIIDCFYVQCNKYSQTHSGLHKPWTSHCKLTCVKSFFHGFSGQKVSVSIWRDPLLLSRQNKVTDIILYIISVINNSLIMPPHTYSSKSKTDAVISVCRLH